jgi:hypothetical protein
MNLRGVLNKLLSINHEPAELQQQNNLAVILKYFFHLIKINITFAAMKKGQKIILNISHSDVFLNSLINAFSSGREMPTQLL